MAAVAIQGIAVKAAERSTAATRGNALFAPLLIAVAAVNNMTETMETTINRSIQPSML